MHALPKEIGIVGCANVLEHQNNYYIFYSYFSCLEVVLRLVYEIYDV